MQNPYDQLAKQIGEEALALSPKEQEMKMALYKSFEEIRAEGHAEGFAEARAEALLIVLQSRGITVPDAARQRILAEKDPRG